MNSEQKANWISEWRNCIKNLSDNIINDCMAVRWEDFETELKERHKVILNSRKSESAYEVKCMKNLEEAVRYLKYKLADFARHTDAFKAAKFQNICRTEISRLEGKKRLYISQQIHRVISQYNISFLNFALFVLIIIVIYALAYAGIHFITKASTVTDAKGNQISGLMYIYFSIVTLTTLGYGDYTPVGKLPQLIAASEAIFGYVSLGFFVYILTHRSEIHPYGPGDWMTYYEEKLNGNRSFY